MEEAYGRPVDIAINHSEAAIIQHKANHPGTKHYRCDVFSKHILQVTQCRKVQHFHASPDCTHFSRAKGGTPVSNKRRGLAWIVVDVLRWATAVELVTLENVEEFLQWGPICPKLNSKGEVERDKDGEILMVPDPYRAGETFCEWIKQIKNLGFKVDYDVLSASDYGVPTIRKRLFLVIKPGAQTIYFPVKTHSKGGVDGKEPFRTAADCIDWSKSTKSIFGREKPLVHNTLKRIGRGVDRFVINADNPFIIDEHKIESPFGDIVAVPHIQRQFGQGVGSDIQEPVGAITAGGMGKTALVSPYVIQIANYGGKQAPAHAIDDPLTTVTCYPKGGSHALVTPAFAPLLIQTGYGERPGQAPRCLDLYEPLGTAVAGGVKHAVVTVAGFLTAHNGKCGDGIAPDSQVPSVTTSSNLSVSTVHFLAKNFGGNYTGPGIDMRDLFGAVTTVDHHSLVASHLLELRGSCKDGRDLRAPVSALCTSKHLAEVRTFMAEYLGYPEEGLPLVNISGRWYLIYDIGMRMLTPRELYRAQGFPDSYIIAPKYTVRKKNEKTGKWISKTKTLTQTDQVRLCGNSVCPGVLKALIQANMESSEPRVKWNTVVAASEQAEAQAA
jgi:DNA (cytosine-5)-methyltransferase 1